jgi:hypothetical protein
MRGKRTGKRNFKRELFSQGSVSPYGIPYAVWWRKRGKGKVDECLLVESKINSKTFGGISLKSWKSQLQVL